MFFLSRYVLFAFVGCALGQVLDYETTPFPFAQTSFTCHGRPPGYYADVETGCATYHVCDGNSHFRYVCPKRTLFQQESKICDHAYRVHCEDSSNFFLERIDRQQINKDNEGQEDIFGLPKLEESHPIEGVIEEEQNQMKEIITTETTQAAIEDLAETVTTFTTSNTTEETSIQTIESIQNSTAESLTVTPEPPPSENDYSSQSPIQYLRVRLKDLRALFYIPEVDNAIVTKSDREFILPLEKNKLMRFKTRKENPDLSSQCPSYCNPKYFVLGTCHPCIMIK